MTQEKIKTVNNIIKHVTESLLKGIMMRKLDLNSTNIIVYCDGSVVGNKR